MDLLRGQCRARSACTYVQTDLALHSPLLFFFYNFLSTELYPVQFNHLNWVYVKVNNLTLSQTTNFRLFQIERVCRRQF